MERDFETCSATSHTLQGELFSWGSNKPFIGMLTAVHYISYCTYSHSLGADEHHLSNKELLALTDILQEDVTDSLKQIGLDFENAQTTIEEVQRLLCSLGEHDIASNLRQHLDLGTGG